MPFEWVKEAGARVGRCMWTDQRHIALSGETVRRKADDRREEALRNALRIEAEMI